MFSFSKYIYLILFFIVVSIAAGLLIAQRNLHKSEFHWSASVQSNNQGIRYLSELKQKFGYGGGIHQFKNYVIRRNETYLAQAEQSLKDSLQLVEKIQQLNMSSSEMELVTIKKTLSEYLSKVQLMKESSETRNLPVAELDKLVQVNDLSAIEAIQSLSSMLESENTELRAKIIEIFNSEEENIIWLSIFIVLILSGFFVYSKKRFRTMEIHLSSADSIIENAINEVLILDLETRKFVYSNKGAQENLKYSDVELSLLSPQTIFNQIDAWEFSSYLETLTFDKNYTSRWTTELERKDGSTYHAMVTIQYTDYEKRPSALLLAHDITEQVKELADHQAILSNKLLEQQALNHMLGIPTNSTTPLKEKLSLAIKEILKVPWMALMNKGGVYLLDGDQFVLEVSENLNPNIESTHQKVSKRSGVFGATFKSAQTVHVPSVNQASEEGNAEIPPHGHYNVPIIKDNRVLGVMVFYLDDGHQKNLSEVQFLESCAEVMARIIESHRQEEDLAVAREKNAVNALIVTYNHEINNPLAIAKGAVILLKKEHQNSPYLGKIENSLNRIEEIVKTVTNISDQNKVYFEHYAGKTRMMNLKKKA